METRQDRMGRRRVTVVSKDRPASSKAVTVFGFSGARAIEGGFEIGGDAINAKG